MKSLAPNTLLQNRYLIVHLIGKGGMGDVYLAVDQRLGSAVALKRTFFSDDEMLGSAFEREAKTLARLRHPVLPKVSDHFTENEEQFLVMEHISGDDLSKRLEAMQKPFPLSWVLFWADHLLDALAYLHAHEPPIIHRDIKPQNLKLTDENHIILLDFGLSKNNTGESRVVSSGSTGSVVGYTPHYAPMEQIRGTGTNPKSDIYSLSATLYQLMTNVVPADALTRADALLNDMSDPIKPISELNNEIPKTVSDVILKGMEISQDRRFAGAREMQKALRDAFSQMQNAMSAQTVAFNVQDQEVSTPPVPPIISTSNEKTEVLNIPPAEILPTPLPETPVTSQPQAYNSNPQNFASVPNQATNQEQNFDATLRMDAPPISESLPKQADVKTEVFLAGSTPVINEVQQENIHLTGGKTADENFAQKTENFAPTDNFSTAEDLGQKTNETGNGGSYAPEATVPLFTFDNQQTPPSSPNDGDFYTTPNVEGGADAFATFTPTENYGQEDFSQAEEQKHQSFTPVAPQQSDSQSQVQSLPSVKKKSGGKILALVAGLGALFVLVAAVAGGGWYYYTNYYLPGLTANPTPSVAPSLEVSPTPIATPEVVITTNTNTSDDTNLSVDSNTNAGNENSNTDANLNTNTSNVGIDKPQPPRPTPQTATPRPTTTTTTPKPTQVKPPTTPPKTPPKNPGGSNRTVILQ